MTNKNFSKFSAWQESSQLHRETIIDDYLKILAKTRVKVRHLTDLADLVARHITQVEGKPCNKATLLRNIRYKAKLISYQAMRLASGVKALNPRTVVDPTARSLITSAQLETGNLKRELERLKIYVVSLEEQVDSFKIQGKLLPASSGIAESESRLSDFEIRFVRTCQALRLLLGYLNLVVQIDQNNRRILDLSKRRNNIIVDGDVAGPFFEWLAVQRESK